MFNAMQHNRQTRPSASTTSGTSNLTPSRSLAPSPSPRGPNTGATSNTTTTTTTSFHTPPVEVDPDFSPFSLPGRVSSTRSGDSFDSYDTHDTHGTRYTDGSGYTNGTGYTSDDPRPPDLGAFNTVLREWGYMFGPTAIPVRQANVGDDQYTAASLESGSSFPSFSQTSSQRAGQTGASQRQTIASTSSVAIPRPRRHHDTSSYFSGDTGTGRLSTVWNQQPIADYLRAVSVGGDVDLSDLELIAPALLGQLQRGARIGRIQEERPGEDTDTEAAQSVVIEHLLDDNSHRGSQESRQGDFAPSIASSPEERRSEMLKQSSVPFPSAANSDTAAATISQTFQFPQHRETSYSPSPHTLPIPLQTHRDASQRQPPQHAQHEQDHEFFDVPEEPQAHSSPLTHSDDDLDELDLDIMDLNAASRIASGAASSVQSMHGMNTPGYGFGSNNPYRRYGGYASERYPAGRRDTDEGSVIHSASRSTVNLNLASSTAIAGNGNGNGKNGNKNNPHAHLYPTAHDSDHDEEGGGEEGEESEDGDERYTSHHRSYIHSLVQSITHSRDPRVPIRSQVPLAQPLHHGRDSTHAQDQEHEQEQEVEYTEYSALGGLGGLGPTSTVEGPSLGYLDEALNFIAEERARLGKERAEAVAKAKKEDERYVRTRSLGRASGLGVARKRDVFDYHSPEEQDVEGDEGDGGGEDGGEQGGEVERGIYGKEEAEPAGTGTGTTNTPKKKRKRKRSRKKFEPQSNQGPEFELELEEEFGPTTAAAGAGEDVEQGDDESDPFTINKLAVTKGGRKKGGLIVLPGPIAASASTSTLTGRERERRAKSVPATPGPAALKQNFLIPAHVAGTGETGSECASPRRDKAPGPASYLSSPYLASAYLSAGTATTTTTAPNTTDSNSGSVNVGERRKTRRKRTRAGRSGRSKWNVVVKEDIVDDGRGDGEESGGREVLVHGLSQLRSTPILSGGGGVQLDGEEEMQVVDVKIITMSVKNVEIPSANEKEAGVEEITEAMKLRKKVEQIRTKGLEKIKLAEERKRIEEAMAFTEGTHAPTKKKKKKDKERVEVKIDGASVRLMELVIILMRRFAEEKEDLVGVWKKLRKDGISRFKEFERQGPGMGMGMLGSEEEGDEDDWEEEDPDPRGKDPKRGERLVHVFVDHSNILIGFLNYVKRHPHLYPNSGNKQSIHHHSISHSSYNPSALFMIPTSISLSASTSTVKASDQEATNQDVSSTSSRPLPPIPIKAKPRVPPIRDTDTTPPSTSISLPQALLTRHQTQMATAAATATPIALPSFATAAKRLTLDTSGRNKSGKGSNKAAIAPPPSAISTIPNEKLIEFEGVGAVRSSGSWPTSRSTSDDVLVFEGAKDEAGEGQPEDSDMGEENEDALGLAPGYQPCRKKQSKRLWHAALALILERGRPVTRRVCVASSPLYQPMYTMKRLSYEVRIYMRVPDLGDGMDRQVKRNNSGTPRKSAVILKGHQAHGTSSGDGGQGATYTSSSGNEASGTKAVAFSRSQKPGTSSDTSLLLAPSSVPSPSTSPRNQLHHHSDASGYHPSHHLSISNPGGVTTRVKYREQGVDELLQLKLHQAIAAADEVPEGSTIVLATGDGNVGQFNEDGFLGPVRTALRRGWKVELYAWEEGLSRAWRKEFGPGSEWERNGRFKIVGMEQFASWLVRDAGVNVH